jgi:hypothetical protein
MAFSIQAKLKEDLAEAEQKYASVLGVKTLSKAQSLTLFANWLRVKLGLEPYVRSIQSSKLRAGVYGKN